MLTAVAPHLSGHLLDTAQSVQRAFRAAASVGWTLRWLIAVDGPGEIPTLGGVPADVHRLAVRAGVAGARNCALAGAHAHGWVLPLDGDDELDANGLAAVLSDPALTRADWTSANRVLLEGSHTPHWRNGPRSWAPGERASAWALPFPFHPNTLLVRSAVARAAGGSPADPGWSRSR